MWKESGTHGPHEVFSVGEEKKSPTGAGLPLEGISVLIFPPENKADPSGIILRKDR